MAGGPRLSRRQLLAGSAALVLAPVAASLLVGGPSVNFAAIGDWGTGRGAPDVAGAIARWATANPLRAIISTGDNFYPHGVSGVDDPLWRRRYERIFRATALNCPWYPVLGNHDHEGSIDAQIAYSAKSPRWRMPARYHLHNEPLADGGSIDFLFIDTTPVQRADKTGRQEASDAFVSEQFAWLEQALASSTARWKFVVGHHPVFSGGTHGSTAGLVRTLKPILDRHRVCAYLNGHDHDLQHIVVDGVNYLTSGSGGHARQTGPIDGTVFAASETGFLAVRATGRTLDFSFINARGETLHSFADKRA